MRERTTIAWVLLAAAALWGCDETPAEMDAGRDAGGGEEDAGGDEDAGGGEDGGRDAGGEDGGPDSGPPIVSFGIRLSNMIGGLTPNPDGIDGNADDNGAIHICLDTAVADAVHLTSTATLPYGGVSPYLPFPWGITYTVTFYDAAAFTACPEDTTDAAALLQATITNTDVALGEFHTAIVTGWTAGGCTASGITTCPAIELDVQTDDYTDPAAGQVRIRVVNGVSHASGAVDVCVVDMAPGADPPILLATGVPVRDVSTPLEIDPITGNATTFIVVTLSGGTPCMGARVGLGAAPTGIAGTIPTNAALQAASDNIPATFDADTNLWLFLFPVGGGPGGADPLAVPWIDAPDPATLLGG